MLVDEAEDLGRTGVMRRSNLQGSFGSGLGREVVEAERLTTTKKRVLTGVEHAINVSGSER